MPWLRRLLTAAVLLLAGLAQAGALAWWGTGQALWWLQIPALAILVVALQGQPSPGRLGNLRAFARGWLFATAWLAGTFWWLFISMHTYGGLAAPLAVLAVLALAAFLALYHAAAGVIWHRLLRSTARPGSARAAWWLPLAFAALWTLAEWMRGTWLTGFPWGAIGYAHLDGPLASLAPWVGVYGMNFVAAWCAALLAGLALRWQTANSLFRSAAELQGLRIGPMAVMATQAMLLVGLLAGAAVLGLLQNQAQGRFTQPAGELRVQLLQGNIPQDEKFELGPGIHRSLSWYGQALVASTAPLVVTAETAIPLLPAELPDDYWHAIRAPFAHAGSARAALVAVPLGNLEEGYTNSLRAFGDGAADRYTYDKHHLVPFGEFIPSGFRWFVRMMNIPLGDFDRGGLPQPPFVWQGQRIAPNICYEDLFGEEIGASFGSDAQAPTLLLNVSNIAWFGDSVAIDQHLAISRLRAMEFERPMLRATNTGATALIDHAGRVLQALPRLTAGVLDVNAQGRTGRTPYAAWVSQWGLWPIVALCLALLALAAWRLRGSNA